MGANRDNYNASLLLCKPRILVFTAASILVFFTFSINTHNETTQLHHPKLPTFSSGRKWRALQSSSRSAASVMHLEMPALQGMGTVLRRGTRPMRELIVAHLSEDTDFATVRLFLRTLHRSGATARADVVILFPDAASRGFTTIFHEEETSFQNLLALSATSKRSKRSAPAIAPFNWLAFKRAQEEEQHVRGEVIWGRNDSSSPSPLMTKPGYGSIVGFEMQDLDAHNALSGFFDTPPPAHLRRWVCYEMLLGMVRTKFRNALITDATALFVGDPLSASRRHKHLYLTSEDHENPNPNPKEHLLSSGFAMGRMDFMHRLASKMATEVVRIALERKTRNPFRDEVALNHLVQRSSVLGKRVLDHVKIVANHDSVVHSLTGSKQPRVFRRRKGRFYAVVLGANSEVVAGIRRDICRSPTASQVYQDC